MGPPISIGNNIPPGPSVIIEDIHNMGPWSGGPYNTEFVTEGARVMKVEKACHVMPEYRPGSADPYYHLLARAAFRDKQPSDPLESKFHPQTEKPESNEGWGVAQDANESTTTSMTWPSELTTAETAPAQLQPTILLRGVLILVGAQIAKPQEKLVAAASFPTPSVPSVVPPAPKLVLGHPPSPPAVNGDAELVSEGWEDPTTVQSPEWDILNSIVVQNISDGERESSTTSMRVNLFMLASAKTTVLEKLLNVIHWGKKEIIRNENVARTLRFTPNDILICYNLEARPV
ncbi:hypothetical protein EV702DRAFT_1046396 [Suillus placidus]|uniref:Uncharacterized protein n=1 Tax=Suillus placidus TaxID=48579 RepID=A0A9P7D243_9AGAM|nr:hypothetical protein EV702DRAFT_1046396 [Suillus placidus]